VKYSPEENAVPMKKEKNMYHPLQWHPSNSIESSPFKPMYSMMEAMPNAAFQCMLVEIILFQGLLQYDTFITRPAAMHKL
jgi:hypothetical protein